MNLGNNDTSGTIVDWTEHPLNIQKQKKETITWVLLFKIHKYKNYV